MKYNLEVLEYNSLANITSINKMDTWFSLKQDKYGNDYIYDLEENKRISLKRALNDINEGLLQEDFNELSNLEQRALNNMFLRYKLPTFKESD